MFKSFWVVLNSVRYRFRFVRANEIPSDRDGDCDLEHPKTIRVREALIKKARLDTIVHEALHAILPNASETKVKQSAHELTTLLWKCGYRKIEQ